ncbi:MAG: HAD family hydrolase [Ignavibacteria bacterium]|nr:HAD family hydrolase [Ignavibacteria bacterium]
MNKAVFLDRDGTLIEEVNYLKKKEEISLFPETKKALLNLKESGFLNIIITNQSGIARGYFDENDLDSVHSELRKILTDKGEELIDGIYYSPYHTEGIVDKFTKESNFRKPGTGMIDQAVKEHSLDIKESFLVGDSITDMLCAKNAGLKKILVKTGYGERDFDKCIEKNVIPEYYAGNIYDASDYIINYKILD